MNKKPEDDIVWNPYPYSTIIHAYVSNLPSNLYYRIEYNPEEVARVRNFIHRVDQAPAHMSNFTFFVSITWNTDKRHGVDDINLKANNFKIIFMYKEVMIVV